MNRRLFACCSAVLLSASLIVAPAVSAQTVEAPDAVVKRLSTELLDTVRNDPQLKSGDPEKVMVVVNDKVIPHINFARMTASTIGRPWRQATPEQRQKLQEEFKNLLVRTYAGALKHVNNQTLMVRPLRAPASGTEVVVNSELQGGSGGPVQLDYRMQLMGNVWKVYDINVMGVWMADSYRNQFAPVLNDSGIDGLIQKLQELARQRSGQGGS